VLRIQSWLARFRFTLSQPRSEKVETRVADRSGGAVYKSVGGNLNKGPGRGRTGLKIPYSVLPSITMTLLCSALLGADSNQKQDVPVIDAEAGTCSVQMTVRDGDGKPVCAAIIRVHVSYGFFGLRKVDVEIGTNADGKAEFVGLPQKESDFCIFVRAAVGRKECCPLHPPRLRGTTFHCSEASLTTLCAVPDSDLWAKRERCKFLKPAAC
jgi:hypothetical protein